MKKAQNNHVTFLGPVGATFSHDAYNILAEIYGAPKVTDQNAKPANNNGEVIKLVADHGGYGALAMETRAEGRVAEPLESIMQLLETYTETTSCPIQIIGAVKMKLHFCMMARKNIGQTQIERVIAHPKALGACREKIEDLKIPTVNAPSNGEAARLIAETDEHKTFAALGPQSAATKYNLTVLQNAFEDTEAVTTFFLLGPKGHKTAVGKENRVLIVYKLSHQPGALVKTLAPFAEEGLNLIQIHSVHAGNGTYNFAIEIEASEHEMSNFERAMTVFVQNVGAHLCFGPFKVLSR